MAENTSGENSSAVASVAIVVLVIVAIIAGYFLFFRGDTGPVGTNGPDIEIELNQGE